MTAWPSTAANTGRSSSCRASSRPSSRNAGRSRRPGWSWPNGYRKVDPGVVLRRRSRYARIGAEAHRTLETDTMAHIPVNHPMRPLYRALSALSGVYLVLFGIVGLIVTPGNGLFGRPDDRVLGQGANLFWSIVAIIIGAIVLIATALGRNLDVQAGKYIGWGLLVVATYELAVSRTD